MNMLKKLVYTFIMPLLVVFSVQAGDLKTRIEAIKIDGLQVNDIEMEGDMITISGTARDNQLISKYLRELDKSAGAPNLEFIKREGNASQFAISIKQK